MSNLFDLNDRIFAAMDELDAAEDAEAKKLAIEKARAKASLFGLVISNANTMASIAKMQEQSMDGLAMRIDTAGKLLGTPRISATMEPAGQRALPEFDEIAWVRANAPGHSVSWIRDRLNKASGSEYGFDEVRGICAEAGVEPVELGDKAGGLDKAESDSYGLRGPAKGYSR